MGIQSWSEDILLVDLPKGPKMEQELETLINQASKEEGCDVVIDFSQVNVITASSIQKLLKLLKFLLNRKRRLIFCSVAPVTMGIFLIIGLDKIFKFDQDKFVALASLQVVD